MIEIDISSPEPIFEQIIGQIGLALKHKLINEGDKLPPIRQLAQDLEINPNTVAKAYQILEECKIIQTNGRSGSIIQKNAAEEFDNWLVQSTKEQLKNVWNKVLALSPNKETANRVWKNSLKELRDE